MNIVEDLKQLNVGSVTENIDIRQYTTYKAGGTATCLVQPKDVESLIILLKYVRENNIKHKIIGRGSNLVFGSGEYNGVLIKLDAFDYMEIRGNEVKVGAGYSLIKLASKVSRLGLTGLEFAMGIPGTVGGAVYMNAGAYRSDMGYVVKTVKVLTPDYQIIEMTNYDMHFHYRSSFLTNNPDYICLEATIVLKRGNPDEIMQLILDRKKRRMESQPLEYPSAGSVFRNPDGDYAGRLIEELGYKGKGHGDAIVSEKHANFVVNMGNAKGDDIKRLVLEIKKRVHEEYGVELIIEQEFVE